MTELLTAGIALLAGIMGSVVQNSTANKKRYEKNIIQERKEWRDKIRKLTAEVNDSFFKENGLIDFQRIKAEFQIRLNPHDSEDKGIINTLDKLILESDLKTLNEFNERVSYLLKYEWEKAKFESSRSYFFSEGTGLIIVFVFSIITQLLFKKNFIILNNLMKNNKMIENNLLFYTLTTMFIMLILLILYRFVITIVLNNPKIHKKLAEEFSKSPKRNKYKVKKPYKPLEMAYKIKELANKCLIKIRNNKKI